MNEAKRRFLSRAMQLFDLGLLVWAFGLATMVIVYADGRVPLVKFLSMRVKVRNVATFAAMLLAWHLILVLCGMYESKRLSTRRQEIVDLLKANILSTACLAFVGVSFSIAIVTIRFLGFFCIFGSVLMVTSRVLLRLWLAALRRRGHNLRYMLILGTNSRAMGFARRIEANPELGYRIVGFVDDDWEQFGDFKNTTSNLVCKLAGLAEFLRHNVIDEVAIYLPLRTFYQRAAEVAELCEKHGIIMRFDPDIFNLKMARAHAEVLGGDPQIIAHTGETDGWPLFVKRTIDLSISIILCILLTPLLLIVCLVVKLSSPGPIFFRQKRVGLNKRQFYIYKFRTMILDAERIQEELLYLNEMTGPVFKIKNDPRITPIGRFLRKTSIDELPQLFNVLGGEMSLVGPRAMSVRDYRLFSEDWQRRRFSVRPGITCLWQVTGRNEIAFEQWMELDMQYIDKWSLWLDLKILARTIPAVLRGSGAA